VTIPQIQLNNEPSYCRKAVFCEVGTDFLCTIQMHSLAAKMLCHYSGGQSPAFKSEGPGFDPRSINVGFVEDKVALVQIFPEVLRFPLSVSFHQCCILIFIYMLLLPARFNSLFGRWAR